MIVPMKKITLLVQEKDNLSALRMLRSLGIVHVRHIQPPRGKDIVSLQEDIAFIGEAIEILFKYEIKDLACMDLAQEPLDWKYTAKHIIDLHKRMDQLQEYSKSIIHNISEWEIWGDFDPDAFKSLAEKNIYIRLYKIPAQELSRIPVEAVVKTVSAEKGMIYCAVISREKIDIPLKELMLPKMGLAAMKARLAQDNAAMENIRKDIHKFICVRQRLQYIKGELEKEMEFQEALRGMGQEKTIVYLNGFIPYDSHDTLLAAARKEKWGLMVDEPAEDEDVPTLLRNPRWVSLLNPVLKLLEIVPGYRELDTSAVFFIFFGMFFGILIGDAGYGLVYFALTMLMQKKLGSKSKDKKPFFLFYILSSCAILWGFLTGTFFGQVWCATIGLRPLVPALNDVKFMQAFCFFVGALHLSIAHVWRASLKLPSLSALAEFGWVGILWSAFLFAKMLILGEPLPSFAQWILFSGMSLVVLFTDPRKNMLKGIGSGLGALALSLMNNFTDVVSYVRLFAVGMAGLAIAETCNIMAASLGGGSFVLVAGSVLILIIGHGLNIVLGPMSVLVHGVRLNVLEFSGHASVTWSGQAYKPLKQ
jgi:V/A-type H+/Na+-transporting ATPase subunit I